MLFDIRQPLPLLFVAALHVGVLTLFQSGAHRPQFTPPETREVVGYLVQPRIEPKPQLAPIQPEALKPPPKIEPEKMVEAPPETAPPVEAKPKSPPKPRRPAKPKATKPSKSAISTPPEPPEAAPVMPVPAAAPVPAPVEAPVPAAPPAPPAPPAPAVVAAPRFDAAYLNNPAPAYPPLSRRMGEEGKVTLRVHVGAGGQAMEVRLHASSGSARLDDAAQEAVRNWRFVPATQAGVPVAAWVLVPVGFRLDE